MERIAYSLLLASCVLSAGAALADPPAMPSPSPGLAAANGRQGPCMKLRRMAMEECRKVSLAGGGKPDFKALFGCIRPIMEGKEAPAGTNIDKALVAECQARRASRQR